MDEQKVNKTLNDAAAAAGASPATNVAGTSTSASETTVKPKFAYEDPELSAHINSMYDAYGNARRTALQEAGDQALSDAQANRDKIAQQYQTQRNMASVDWERQRRNFMESANMNGLNTGAGGQAQLAMQGKYQQTQNQLGYQQANAEAEADRQMADIKRQTQAQINEAVAENDYKRAAALLDQYNVMYQRAIEKAQALAQFGDFSGYGSLYGENQATQMSNMWYAQNPDLAYMMGLITSDQRDNIKANRPINDGLDENGVRVGGSGGGAYGGGSGEWAGNIKNSWLHGNPSGDPKNDGLNEYGQYVAGLIDATTGAAPSVSAPSKTSSSSASAARNSFYSHASNSNPTTGIDKSGVVSRILG